jgi:aminoglycoside phosphotransferase family enzyme
MRPLLAATLDFLRRPGSYPGHPRRVRVIETHMSWLFLAGAFAYKLKKPLARNGMDHRSRDKRRRACRRELRLNRRLAPDVYLDVCALTLDGEVLAIGGAGRPIDWLLRMRRLPEARTLERRLRRGRVGPVDAGAIVARLAPFFRAATPGGLDGPAYARKLRGAIDEATARLLRPRYGLDADRIRRLARRLHACIDDPRIVPLARRARRVVEGHGDLRPEHIYLADPPAIIDCIEFDRRLRVRDPLEELAFLAMECDRAGHPEMDAWLFGAWRRATGDRPARALVEFYKAFDAFLRGRIAAWHMDDPETGPAVRWRRRACDYFDHAERCLRRAGAPA